MVDEVHWCVSTANEASDRKQRPLLASATDLYITDIGHECNGNTTGNNSTSMGHTDARRSWSTDESRQTGLGLGRGGCGPTIESGRTQAPGLSTRSSSMGLSRFLKECEPEIEAGSSPRHGSTAFEVYPSEIAFIAAEIPPQEAPLLGRAQRCRPRSPASRARAGSIASPWASC